MVMQAKANVCVEVAYASAKLTATAKLTARFVVGDSSVNKELVSGVCHLARLAMFSSALFHASKVQTMSRAYCYSNAEL